MKASKYNIFYPYKKDSKKYIACNILTTSLAVIDEEQYIQYKDFCDKGITIQESRFLNDLKIGGFLIEKNIDELEIIRHDMFNAKFNSDHLTLTITPTLDCNFRCIYCFEKEVINKCKMSKKTADQIVSYIKEKSKFLKSINIVWYGGEPLLEIDIIEYLSNKIIKISDKNNIIYTASIVTNGYGLNDKAIQILQKSRVTNIQVTVDGDEETHDIRRPLKNGSSTFNKIIENLQLAKKYNCKIHLRINVDKSNKMESFAIVDFLKKMNLEDYVVPYLAIVKNYNDCYINDKCISSNEYLEIKTKFYDYIMEKGFITSNDLYFLSRVNCFCGAETANSIVINWDGELYKCWHDIGNKSKSVGNINDRVITNSTYLEYVMSDPTKDEDCANCRYLPICFSGCPLDRQNKDRMRCLEIKSNLERNLQLIIESRL